MSTGWFDQDAGSRFRGMAAVAACLLLTVCAGPAAPTKWAKAGVDDTATAREIDDCRAQASTANNNEQGINQDISTTLGRNWQMSQTTRLRDQSMQRQATGFADRIFDNCMLAKGFKKQA